MGVKVATSAHRGCVATEERLKHLRQLASLRYARTLNQHQHDRDLALERGLDLDANPIVLIRNPRRLAPARTDPVWSNDSNQGAAPVEHLMDVVVKVDTVWNIDIVHEDAVVSIVLGQTVEDPASRSRCIVSTIGEDDLDVRTGHVTSMIFLKISFRE
jgi:hypothetical protein